MSPGKTPGIMHALSGSTAAVRARWSAFVAVPLGPTPRNRSLKLRKYRRRWQDCPRPTLTAAYAAILDGCTDRASIAERLSCARSAVEAVLADLAALGLVEVQRGASNQFQRHAAYRVIHTDDHRLPLLTWRYPQQGHTVVPVAIHRIGAA